MSKTFGLWATVLRWVDGDTFAGFIDQGFNDFLGSTEHPVRVRCALINAPEMSTVRGPEAWKYAQQIAPPGEYPCTSYRPDEYGRPLVDLHLPTGLFSAVMLGAGQAVLYKR